MFDKKSEYALNKHDQDSNNKASNKMKFIEQI